MLDPELSELVRSLGRRLSAIEKTAQMQLRLRQVRVIDVDGNELLIETESGTVDHVRCFSWYVPDPPETVWALQDGPEYIVLGDLA